MTQQSKQSGTNLAFMIVLGILGLAALLLLTRGCFVIGRPWSMHVLGVNGSHGPALFPFLYGMAGIWGVIQIVLAIWVGVDANRRGLNGFLWGLLVLFTHIVGLIIYLIVAPMLVQRNGTAAQTPAAVQAQAPPVTQRRCIRCEAQVQAEFKACPFCGASLRCGQCDKPVQAGWKVCPHCTSPLVAG